MKNCKQLSLFWTFSIMIGGGGGGGGDVGDGGDDDDDDDDNADDDDDDNAAAADDDDDNADDDDNDDSNYLDNSLHPHHSSNPFVRHKHYSGIYTVCYGSCNS